MLQNKGHRREFFWHKVDWLIDWLIDWPELVWSKNKGGGGALPYICHCLKWDEKNNW